jgi:hypothetical protein
MRNVAVDWVVNMLNQPSMEEAEVYPGEYELVE